MMPGMRGDELITRLMHRRDPIPCILMSAYLADAGPLTVPFLGKPFALETLLNVVGGVMQEQLCLSA